MKKRIVMVNPGPRRTVTRRTASRKSASAAAPQMSDEVGNYRDPTTRVVIEPNALKHMKIARTRLIGPFDRGGKPWMGAAAMALTFIPRTNYGTLGVDSSWRLYYDPDEIVYWPVDALAAVIEHELWHLLRKHHRRAADFGIDQFTHTRWNIAGDTEIHSDEKLLQKILSIPKDDPRKQPAYPARFNLPRKQTVEWYYNALFPPPEEEDEGRGEGEGEGEEQEPGPGGYPGRDPGEEPGQKPGPGGIYVDPTSVDPAFGSSGSAADGIPQPHELPPTDDTVNEAEENVIIRRTAEEIRSTAKQYGDKMGDALIEWSDIELEPPRVDWRDVLRNAIDDAIEYQRGQLEHTWRRMSPRQPASPDVRLAGMQSPTPMVAVVLDTSASMFAKSTAPKSAEDAVEGEQFKTLLYDALNEIGGLLEQLGSTIGVNVLVTDTAVHSAEQVFDIEDLELVGGGGTNMGVGLEAAADLVPQPNVVICLTDGYTPWPEEEPGADAAYIIGIVGSTEESLGEQWTPPEWVDEVVFIDEEL